MYTYKVRYSIEPRYWIYVKGYRFSFRPEVVSMIKRFLKAQKKD